MFKVGDKVKYVGDECRRLTVNKEYAITQYNGQVIGGLIGLKNDKGDEAFYGASNFELVEEIDDSLDKLRNIVFDSDFEPNVSSVTDVGGIMALNEHLAKEAFKLGSKDDKVLEIIRRLI